MHLHLAEVLVREFVKFEVNDDIAAKQPVVEDEVEEVVVAIESEALLAGFEEEALAEFEEEFFQMGDDGGLKIGFGVASFFVQPQEFQHQGILQNVFGLRDDLALGGEAFHARLVAAKGETVIEGRGFLAFEFADIPIRLSGFNFVKASFV